MIEFAATVIVFALAMGGLGLLFAVVIEYFRND